jgi:hypothetical protein
MSCLESLSDLPSTKKVGYVRFNSDSIKTLRKELHIRTQCSLKSLIYMQQQKNLCTSSKWTVSLVETTSTKNKNTSLVNMFTMQTAVSKSQPCRTFRIFFNPMTNHGDWLWMCTFLYRINLTLLQLLDMQYTCSFLFCFNAPYQFTPLPTLCSSFSVSRSLAGLFRVIQVFFPLIKYHFYLRLFIYTHSFNNTTRT